MWVQLKLLFLLLVAVSSQCFFVQPTSQSDSKEEHPCLTEQWPFKELSCRMAKRTRGTEGGISIRGEDGQFRQKSWKEISPELSSSSGESGGHVPVGGPVQPPHNAGGGTSDPQRHNFADEPVDYGAGGVDDHGDATENSGGPAAQDCQQPSLLDSYVHQLLSIHQNCVPPLVPSGLEQAAEQHESTFCVPGFDLKKRSLTYEQFAMPGLRRVPLIEGGFGVAHWCTCCPELELQKCIFSGLSHGRQEQAFLDDQVPQCLHLEAVLKLAGAVNLDAHSLCGLSKSRPEEDAEDRGASDRLLVLPYQGTAPRAMLVGTVASGCVVVVEKVPGRWNCTQCYGKGKQNCWHIQAIVGSQEEVTPSRMTASEFEEQFKLDFDPTTGKRRLRCLSRATIPEAHRADPALADILLRRGRGELAFPARCVVEADGGA